MKLIFPVTAEKMAIYKTEPTVKELPMVYEYFRDNSENVTGLEAGPDGFK